MDVQVTKVCVAIRIRFRVAPDIANGSFIHGLDRFLCRLIGAADKYGQPGNQSERSVMHFDTRKEETEADGTPGR